MNLIDLSISRLATEKVTRYAENRSNGLLYLMIFVRLRQAKHPL